ncbi:uncharacterized protein N7498_007942 [Penicillium cinerascens]|uniref:Glycoside hydrolase family 125 protein n=1 Tax=Penicillium cinerascens TaxID=70096 RepID=A0A9W9JCF9_9EURO|nr:uncharacterized protein N7498_007942 [Penicillium cinerascens]KAJ5194504.1 hypothetical protein N7498_007942 [Penicillium cinerascens]
MWSWLLLVASATVVAAVNISCPTDYTAFASTKHAPLSSGKYHLSYMRPPKGCRTFNSPEIEKTITRMQSVIKDPDLYRLFENSWPNTLDTTIKWRGYAADNLDEELCFLITGDIDAMWLRDSANQLQSYLSMLTASDSEQSLAALYRGVINLQSRYLLEYPYCQAFQPPTESGLTPSVNSAANDDTVTPPYSNQTVFECKYELDSLAAFLAVSTNYFGATQDAEFFGKYQWRTAVRKILNETQAQRIGTYGANGSVNPSAYAFTRETTDSEDTQDNNGMGNPFRSGTGLVRSFFRPSDDATIFQGFIPGNMMFARYLESASLIAKAIKESDLAVEMQSFAKEIRAAIGKYGIAAISAPCQSDIYAFEVDGYSSRNIMDDANIPSLLAAPFFGYLNENGSVYQATREILLSSNNPYYMEGPVITGIGSVHTGPGYVWPMALVVRILTSNNDDEITSNLQQLLRSTNGLGLLHESVNSYNQSDYTRPWFAWVNGLFGQMILDLEVRKPHILGQSFQ